MSQSILIQKTLKFSAEIIKLQQYLSKEKDEMFNGLINDCLEIKKMLVSTLNTIKKNIK